MAADRGAAGVHRSGAAREVLGAVVSNYDKFLSTKEIATKPSGISGDITTNDMLFGFQSDIVKWSIRIGRACIFADCGLGKTPMQLEWARHIPGRVLILAPLAVSDQTVREGAKFGIPVIKANAQSDIKDDDKIIVTNYEKLHRFSPSEFAGVVLDESSILKSYDGKTRNHILSSFRETPYRLACTATPSPNDYMELGNHAEFVGALTYTEMLSTFFVHDGGETQKWRLKGHAQLDFWKWLCSWAVLIRKPSDLGYDDNGFILPPINYHHVTVEAKHVDTGTMFPMPAASLQERIAARRNTVAERCRAAAQLAGDGPTLFWCNLNAESEMLTKMIDGAVEVKGSDSHEHKESALLGFSDGSIKHLVTKPSIAGFGMNWQHCSRMVFVGLNDSFEQFYQATRRCWRFGQQNPVEVYIVTADIEGAVVKNIERKEELAHRMVTNMLNHMSDITKDTLHGTARTAAEYKTESSSGDGWDVHLGDCIPFTKTIPSDSIDYTIFSPPFASLYTYSASERDMGNCRTDDEFFKHFSFLVGDLLRVTRPGRLLSFHCMNLPTSKTRDGVIGIKDFRGDLIRMFTSCGWIYHSEVCIWKDPVTAMQRTKALGLLHKQMVKDSAMSRQGIPDYLVTMRKPGENDNPVSGKLDKFIGDETTFQRSGDLSIDIWQRYASPIWTDIRANRTLQYRAAKANEDERHICPLQLDVIERGIQLWTNPGDLVYSPFAGIGSEGYCAVSMGRRFVGVELKESYYKLMVKNMIHAEQSRAGQLSLGVTNA